MAWPSRVAGVAEAGTVLGHARGFLDFYAGVFSLVALSLTVMGGLLAMDRLVLRPPHRVRLQLLHRGVATAAVGFLAVHVALRVVDGHVGGRTAAMGAGTLAALLMVVLAASGIARGRFAYRTRPGVWRALHATAYLCWPLAVLHGLTAGRVPAPWVTASYAACLAAVALALLGRLAMARGRRVSARRAARRARRVPAAPVRAQPARPDQRAARRPPAAGPLPAPREPDPAEIVTHGDYLRFLRG